MQTALGLVVIKGTSEAITEIAFADTPLPVDKQMPEVMKQCMRQLQEYFDGKRATFDLPLQPEGNAFQEQVWKILQQIGYASTASYRELSLLLGDDKKARAVGSASAANPILIVVPCHRLIGSDDNANGYAGGLWRKQWLLEHEAHHGRGARTLFD